jgi:uncharacterized damage-inducible protein DinB
LTTSASPISNSIPAAFIKSAREYLVGDYLPKIERCLVQLTEDQVWWRGNDQSNSIGNLILHLCGNVRQWIICGLGGEADHRQRDEEFAQREVISRADLLERLRETLMSVDAVLAGFDTSTLLETRRIQGNEVTGLEAIFHVTEHFSMHTGQIILLTKLLTAVDLEFYDL